jgi:hypothetical protein
MFFLFLFTGRPPAKITRYEPIRPARDLLPVVGRGKFG